MIIRSRRHLHQHLPPLQRRNLPLDNHRVMVHGLLRARLLLDDDGARRARDLARGHAWESLEYREGREKERCERQEQECDGLRQK